MVTSYPYQSFIQRWNANYVAQNHPLRPPCRHTPLAFRADEMEVPQQTKARIDFHDGCWENVFDEGTPEIVVACENALI